MGGHVLAVSTMPTSAGRERGNVAIIMLLVVALVLAVPLSLHFTQKAHDRLPLSVLADYPANRPFVQGEAYGSTLAALMDHELNSGTGWRPNDFVLWGPGVLADNNANRQRGIIMAVRESTRVLKDHLTKVSSTEYDSNLVEADTAFRNDESKFWLPSAESKFRDGTKALRRYVDGLRETPPQSKPITGRNVELIRLVQAWGDLLGDAHANLFKTTESDGSPVKPWRNDDYFYHAQGVAHVIHHLADALRVEYRDDLKGRPQVDHLLEEVSNSLRNAGTMKPVIVLDGSPTSIFANHRRNLDAYIVDARQKLYSVREELEK
jgi:hypothetical protein